MLSFISSFKKIAMIAIASSALGFVGYRVIDVQLGYAIKANKTETWFGNVARMRDLLYEKRHDSTKNTIFVVSGSNSLFGIASGLLAERTNYNVRNYSLHAGMHIDLLLSQIREKVKSGDIVVVPMEWEARNRVKINQFDYENYLHHLSKSVTPTARIYYNIFSSVPLHRWTEGIREYIYRPHDAVSYWDFYTPKSLQYAWDIREKNENYTHRALNEFGDINIELPMTRASWKDKSSFQVPEKPDPKWLLQIGRWQSYFKDIGVKLILTSPVMLEGNGPEIFSLETWRRISRIRDQMAGTKTPLYCDPIAATFASLYRYDTSYHPNAQGARLRTESLAECLVDLLSNKDVQTKPISSEAAVASIKSRFFEQKRDFGVGNLPFQIRLREITAINEALKDFYQKNGKYPASSIPDDWGFPIGIGSVFNPNAPSKNGAHGIAYWSNGVAYKLKAKAPNNECTVVFANWPTMIDMAGLENSDPTFCTGYGYWTEDQKLR